MRPRPRSATASTSSAASWGDASGGTFDDLDPFTGDVVARVAAGPREDAARAIERRGRGLPGLVAGAAGGAPARSS